MDDLISRQDAIDAICKACTLVGDYHKCDGYPETSTWCDELVALRAVPSAQPERLTDDDIETIRIHLSATKEKLCNHHRWKLAEEYERLIERFMAFASAQPETCEGCKNLGKWKNEVEHGYNSPCTGCRRRASDRYAR